MIKILLAAVLPLVNQPFTYVGRIVSFDHIAADAGAVTIQAYNSSGQLVAKTETFASTDSAYNYRLAIPIASQPASGYATVGETLTFRIYDSVEDETFLSLVPVEKSVVGAPGDRCRLDLMLSTDADGDGVSDQYVRGITQQMRRAGFDTWDPDADFDGDGQSNRAEIEAGTSMFSAEDYFHVKSAEGATDGTDEFFALTFFANPGRTYSVLTSPALGEKASWGLTGFRLGPKEDEIGYLPMSSTESGTRQVFIRKDPEASAAFYTVDVQ